MLVTNENRGKYYDNHPTTNCALTIPNDNYKNNNHYFTFARTKVYGAIKFCNRMGIDYFEEDIFQTFNVSNRK